MTSKNLLPAAARPQLGPAMQQLTAGQRRFVESAFIIVGGPTAWARAAGYRDSGKSGIRVQAHRLRNNPKVIAAMREEAEVRLKIDGVPRAIAGLLEMVENKDHKQRHWAIGAILSRAGLHEVVETKTTVEVEMTVSEQFAELVRLGRKPEEILANLPVDEREKVLTLVRGEYQELQQ